MPCGQLGRGESGFAHDSSYGSPGESGFSDRSGSLDGNHCCHCTPDTNAIAAAIWVKTASLGIIGSIGPLQTLHQAARHSVDMSDRLAALAAIQQSSRAGEPNKKERPKKQKKVGAHPRLPPREDRGSMWSPLQRARQEFNKTNRHIAIALLAQSKDPLTETRIAESKDPLTETHNARTRLTETRKEILCVTPHKRGKVPHTGAVNKQLAAMWSTSTARADLLANSTTKELKKRRLTGPKKCDWEKVAGIAQP